MIKIVKDNEKIYAKIIRANYPKDETEFFTEESDELQFGIVKYEKNHKSGAHYHNRIKQKTNQVDEILLVQSGSLRADFYNIKGDYIKSYLVNQGDILIIYQGGHNFHFNEDTKVMTIKTGAYDKDSSKTRILGINNLDLQIDEN